MANRRWQFLKRHPLCEEIELRLRHRWAADDVQEWLERDNPQQPPIDAIVLDRYRQAQGAGWLIPVLVPAPLGRRPVRLLALEQHAAVCAVQIDRLRRFLLMEQDLSLPIPEIRANLELLARLLAEQVGLQQRLGYLPTAPRVAQLAVAVSKDETDDDHELVRRLLALPADEFSALVPAALGPPPGSR